MPAGGPKLLIIAAHPDDAEYHAGGLATIYREHERPVKMLSVTDGAAGHFERNASDLITLRRFESSNAGKVIGAEYETLHFPDGQLQASLEVRHRIIREIRMFRPDLVLTHRTCDYHPDHRAVGQAIQDASYLVTVPRILPELPALTQPPVYAYMPDLFTRPVRHRADVVLDIADYVDVIVKMLACQHSQVFEWLPYEEGTLETVPDDDQERLVWLRDWYTRKIRPRADHFRSELVEAFGKENGNTIEFIEAYEICEYGVQPDALRRRELFPFLEKSLSRDSQQPKKREQVSIQPNVV
ncbi:PIG-L deacetylase family protein [Bythopirellula goksoeyrii]|nr:PIG-L deacetylase family protein [Bythopirellula goksoeyrii]